jgi:transcriptional regulator GlxA family with amidase domain
VAKDSGKPERLQSAIEFIRTNASDPIRLEDMALDCGFESLRTFNRTFKQ